MVNKFVIIHKAIRNLELSRSNENYLMEIIEYAAGGNYPNIGEAFNQVDWAIEIGLIQKIAGPDIIRTIYLTNNKIIRNIHIIAREIASWIIAMLYRY